MPLHFVILVLAGVVGAAAVAPDPPRPIVEIVGEARKARAAGDFEKARRLFEEALVLDPRGGPIALELGETLLDSGDAAGAERVLSRLCAAAPDKAAPRRALARAQLALGKPRQALENARQAAILDPKSTDGAVLLGFALVASGQAEDAVAAFRRALARRPQDRDAHGGLAMSYAALSDPRAAGEFETVLAAKSEARYHWQYAEHLWKTHDVDRGNAQMEKALQAARGDSVLLAAYGMKLSDQGRFPEAARRLKEARAAGQNDYEVIYQLGSVELENNHFEDAERILKEAIAVEPKRSEARHRLGALLLLAGKPGAAREELSRAAELAGDDAALRVDLGRAEEALGNLEAAEADYRRAVGLAPDLARARYLLALLLARRGKPEESRREMALYQAAYEREQAGRQAVSALAAEINLGWAELNAKRYGKALAQFERHPDNPEALRGAAEALSRMGRRGEAIATLERALVINPEDRGVAWRLREERRKAAP
jgi:tetratricopeptide (TPR) repeat protein